MAIRYKALTELYQETQRSVTAPDQWRAFLASACRNYRLSFDEQLLVYAQRPDATAVLEIERWNRQFGRWVNRGANGIAVFDGEHNGKPRLKYYFDISDTHEARFPRPVPLWTVREEYAPDIIETLENSFGELERKEDLGEALLNAAKNAVEDNMPDYLAELKTLTEGSFLEELDELNLEVEYRRAVQNSIGYMLLVRCGLDPSEYFEDEDFRDVLNFNTPQTLNALGVATGDISQMCLSAISRTVLALQRQPQKENRTFEPQQKNQYAVTEQENTQPERSFEYDRDHLHQAGRLQSAEPSAAPGGAGSPWEIRIASEEVSQGAPQGDVHQPADQRQAEQPSGGDPADRPAPDGGNRGADGESRGRDGGTESQRPDEVGADDEQPAERGGGNGAGGADLQLIDEPEESAGGEQLPALLDEKQIMAIIANKDDDLKYKKNQIELFFSVHSDVQERAEYLKSAYQDRYTEIIADGQRLGYKPQENGLLMWEGSYPSRTKESVFSWDIVAQWTAQLIDKKEYFIQTDIPQLPTQESQQMSLFDFAAFQQPAQAEGTAQPSIFPHPALPQQVIDEALCIGANDQNSRLIICAYFKKDKPDNARFLAEHYGENGAGFYLDGRQYHILEQTLNQRDVRVFDYIEDENGKKKPVLNKKETAIAQDRQELIKQKFAEWIWKDIDRRELLCRIYNETFNGVRPREYDGRHIRFEGMNPEISLRPHQINAIAHILYGGNTLLAHEVGAGKTYEMVAAAMEMKRLGLCTKSLIVVPNHITEQWAAEWLQLYPSANILVATKKDFETQNRKKFCSRIATGDYDAIIIGHSQFEKIPMSVERQQAILERQIEEILEGIEQAKAQKAER